MEHKNSAGMYVGGISLTLASPLIIFIAVTFGTRMAYDNGTTELGLPFVVTASIGGLLGIVGLILLIGAGYRALAKIDALR